eukprot:SAG11_NODE_2019_length_3914_cov_2.546908_4_plen_64_part_00
MLTAFASWVGGWVGGWEQVYNLPDEKWGLYPAESNDTIELAFQRGESSVELMLGAWHPPCPSI